MKQAFSLFVGPLYIRVRVDEDVEVIECSNQLRFPRQQHSVAEHIPTHVSDSDHGIGVFIGVNSERSEVDQRLFPGASRCDGQFLVVVSVAAP